MSSRRAPNTRCSYRTAWKQFLEFTRKQPLFVTSTDIAGWIESQRAQGLAACTIRQRLAAISSFYTYTTRTFTLLVSDGREKPIHHFNPFSAVPHHTIFPNSKTK
ncbi:MAG: site-specific integrase [Chloroflexota bacterium]|nr:site-specific integrase [Chloroflexota bacterium]